MNAESEAEPSREELIALVAALRANIAELERRLGLNSSNSGKPPSGDGLKKPARVSSLRERCDRPAAVCRAIWGFTLDDFTDDDVSPGDHAWLDQLTQERALEFGAAATTSRTTFTGANHHVVDFLQREPQLLQQWKA